MPKIPNLRDMTVDTGKGKDVKDTSMLSGEATETKAEREKNSTTQYETPGGVPKDNLGGMNTGC